MPSSSKINTKKDNPLKLTDLARDKIKLNDRDLNKESAKKCLIPTILKINYFIIF